MWTWLLIGHLHVDLFAREVKLWYYYKRIIYNIRVCCISWHRVVSSNNNNEDGPSCIPCSSPEWFCNNGKELNFVVYLFLYIYSQLRRTHHSELSITSLLTGRCNSNNTASYSKTILLTEFVIRQFTCMCVCPRTRVCVCVWVRAHVCVVTSVYKSCTVLFEKTYVGCN